MGRKYGFSFSWKRAVGISGAKGRISRQLGIPVTRSGRERKLGRMMTGGKCFVATACYGDPEHPVVITLRRFRDEVLRRHAIGRSFVAWYYRRGPELAALIEMRPVWRSICRVVLRVVATALRRIPTLQCRFCEQQVQEHVAHRLPTGGR